MFNGALRARLVRRVPLSPALRRWAHCIGCGSDLVMPISRSRSEPSSLRKSAAAEQTSSTSALLSEMSTAQRAALNWDDTKPEQLGKHELQRSRQRTRSAKAHSSKLCKPCVMSREGTMTELLLPSVAQAPLGRKFHVIDALDFPMGVPFAELAGPTGSGDVFVINRCDLVVARQSQLGSFKRYVMKTVFSPLGVPEDRVHTVSAKHGWNLKKLSESFVSRPKDNCFVGPANSGKTSLVHQLAGTTDVTGPTAWPVPFTTQYPVDFRAQSQFRNKTVVDMPSCAGPAGLAPYDLLTPSVLRKVGKGQQIVRSDPKYPALPIRARSGQTVSIGGLVALEFPRLAEQQLPIHVFPLINGFNHTRFGQAFRNVEKLAEINASLDPKHEQMRMHNRPGLRLEPVAEFQPVRDGERQSLVIKGLGFVQPFLFGKFPDGYAATVHAPRGVEVAARPEFLPK